MFFFYAVQFVFGIVFGSFLSVVIHRLPNNQSIVSGRSACPHCGHVLGPLDLVPILSYIALRGRCRYCGAHVSWLYPILELITGGLFVLALAIPLASGSTALSYLFVTDLYYCALFTLLCGLFFIDLFYQLLLDVLVFPALGITVLYHGFLWWYFLLNHHVPVPLPGFLIQTTPSVAFVPAFVLSQTMQPILFGYIFGVGVAVFFLLLILVTRGKGMGGGDVKYALVLGAASGWPNCITALFGAFISGAVVGIVLLLLGKKRFGNVIPFGPFLIGATIFAILFGKQLVDMYLGTVLP